jgi:deoxyribodipyrimidine photo-lyase
VEERVRKIGPAGARTHGEYVLYWIRANRRVECNHALQFAAGLANRLAKPLLCYEALPSTYPYANDRLHAFTLEGVAETAAALHKLGAGYIFDVGQASWPVLSQPSATPNRAPGPQSYLRGSPGQYSNQAAAVVTDDWPEALTGPVPEFGVETYVVDSSCIVPSRCIEARSYAAYSIRPKIHRLLERFLQPVEKVHLRHKWIAKLPALPALNAALCEIDHSVPHSTLFRGGRKQAELCLDHFLENRLRRYALEKNQPAAHATSNLSPYLHYGHISSLEVALRVREHARQHKLIANEFLEELIVRRELAFNFAWYAKRVDSLTELPDWARATLRAHRKDKRDPRYAREQFEQAATHDGLWNAAQKELLLRGKIHGYYRMYWGKKIIEWSRTPEDALATMLYLNDKYALDGQDPNSYANILWCFGLHDRPWGERPILGMVRYMARSGMDRKTDVKSYLSEINRLERTGKELTT